MRSFEQERISHTQLNSSKFKFPIPVACVAPKNISDSSCVFVYSSGLWSTISTSLYLNNDFYNNHWFITYDKMAHGQNQNKPSQYRKPYINELYEVVKWAKNSFPNRKIYLLGESWGAAISLIFLKKYGNLVDGVVGWNTPFRPKDSEKNTFKVKLECAIKEIFTIVTQVTVTLPAVQKTRDKVSRNELFIRVMSLKPIETQNSKSTISVWRFMHSSKHFLKRNGRNKNMNYLYIQSGQDALCDYKLFKRITKNSNQDHVYYMPTGYHVLSLEPVESNQLYDKINEFINRSKHD